MAIPAYRRPERLARCLEALCQQSLPRDDFEVIVCDDGSPRPLAPVIAGFAHRLRLSALAQPNAGPAAARNRAARAARGGLIAFTDDDCAPAPDWLERLAAHHARRPDAILGGAIANALPGDPYASATQVISSYVYGYYQHHPETRALFSTSNLAVPTSRFHQLGGFSEAFPRAAGEDYDLCARWHQRGWPTVYASDALVWHAHGHDAASFWRQHFDYGRSLLRVRQRAARRDGRRRLRLEAPGFYAGLLAAPLRDARGWRALRLATLVLLSQAATAAGAAREALGGRWARADEPDAAGPRAEERDSARPPTTPPG